MSKQTRVLSNDMDRLAEDARALMIATAGMAGDKVEEARQRLAAALDGGRGMCGRAIDGARAANEAMHEHPYKAVATGIGIGAIFGYLFARRCHCS